MTNTTKLPELSLPNQLKEQLAQGHPWVYRNHTPSVRLPAGAWVKLRCGGWSGYGLWDSEGPIAVRVFGQQQPDAALVRERVRQAWDLRAPLRAGTTTAYRWLFGEGDSLPGITVDIYGEYAVVATYMNGTAELLEWLIPALRATAPLRGIVLRHRPGGDGAVGREADEEADEVRTDRPAAPPPPIR
ncbi:MAG: class I SAM-dependent rRNA methyltransferase, partial [Roseiflexaceae bacterium]|nr:class I SAM-dependent rRNA methyltransferase [Roseiflexaceae bacterium]